MFCQKNVSPNKVSEFIAILEIVAVQLVFTVGFVFGNSHCHAAI
jgi:hypothetical protein